MDHKLDIRREGDVLEIAFEGHDGWTLFRRRMQGPFLVFTFFAAVAFALAGAMGFAPRDAALAIGAFYAFEMLLICALFYRDVRGYAKAMVLRVDDEGVVLLDSNGDTIGSAPLDAVHMLQNSPVTTSVDPRSEAGALLPDGANRELTLHTDDGLTTVARGVSRRRTRRAVEAFEEQLEAGN